MSFFDISKSKKKKKDRDRDRNKYKDKHRANKDKGGDRSGDRGGDRGNKDDSRRKKRSKPMPIALSSLDSEEYTKLLRTCHDQSEPYNHLVLDPLYDPEKLRQVHEEVKNNMTATYKETDLFKLFQTGELGNITPDDELGQKMPELLKLRESIYSQEFRTFVQNITGCAELTDRVDFSGNAYTCQCHLMCHDDVISTRCVSFIIYLTDPDEPWTTADGGALELYPLEKETADPTAAGKNDASSFPTGMKHRSSLASLSFESLANATGGSTTAAPTSQSNLEQGVPAPIPSLNILPKSNSMAMFVVQPGRSYHAVQEVFGDMPRLSISGWFHAAEPPVGSSMASLKQIMSSVESDLPFVPIRASIFNGCPEDSSSKKSLEQELREMEISTTDMNILKQYLSMEYLRPASMLKIRNTFIEESSVQLYDFLNDDIQRLISESSFQADESEQLGSGQVPRYTTGMNKRWSCIGPPHKHRYLRYEDNVDTGGTGEDAGALLADIRQQLFRTPVFHRYLHKLTNLRVTEHRDEIRRFRPGLDYTVAHHGTLVESPRMDATLCFADTRTKEKAEMWDGGDVGGFECYIAAEDDTDADATAEVYKSEKEGDENEDGDLLSVQAGCNVLNIVMRDEGVMKFVKYVSHKAPSSRWDIALEYNVEVDSDDEYEDVSAEEDDLDDEEDGGSDMGSDDGMMEASGSDSDTGDETAEEYDETK
eukprot:CAMPEP_0114423178 /NCGR_PEP_ID=MMETSP0103-20121206/6010_1 /TAXON_ID=37642 ORGANISM="Paraphysomonas imperforata, Strain PA2" /NCGR_SAMPLE_ID=MMETSP0103 /ASSEMBLY_ACC=CAM_ASM_000201 /LENGTH=708 /DNA_ID=CAMNT_0001591823 /DNA_START=53 /DNA_END=2179 /DNA_ORIENTATION=+